MNRLWSAHRHEQKREEERKKGRREVKERTKVHFYYNITSPLIALITPKGKQNLPASSKFMNN